MDVSYDWPVRLSIEEVDGQTGAEVRLVMPGGHQLVGHGLARRNPADREVARIGAQVATARAFSDLAGRLLQVAAAGIEDSTHKPAHLDQ